MTLELFAHPFSSYCQKALIALYENELPFTYRQLSPDEPQNNAELKKLWPHAKFPVLLDDGRVIVEATIIIEHLHNHFPGPVRLMPDDADAALEVRMLDRIFDNYVMTPMNAVVFNALRPEPERSARTVSDAVAQLETSYRWLDAHMATRQWAAADRFSLADCAAAPSLFYADWVHQIAPEYAHLHRYRSRLLARPSFARAVEEARPYRAFFPLGAPDRD